MKRQQEVPDVVNLPIPQIPLQMDPQGLLGPLKPIKLKLVPRSDASEHVDMSN